MDSGTRRFVSIVVAIMLLLAGLMTALILIIGPNLNEDSGTEGWHMKGGSIIVDGNAKWVRWNKTLIHPVHIVPGGNLVIEDSQIEIPLERLIFSSEPGFNLSNDSLMRVVNSTISVKKDPRLYKALFDPWEGEISTPAAWRVANLKGSDSFVSTIDPFLEFSVLMTEGEGTVVAAVQRMPDEIMKPLFVVGSNDVEPMKWKDVRISLASFIGTTPRITVFIHESTARDVLISDLRISNDGDPLPGDIAMMGRPDKEGWSTGHLYKFMEHFRDWDWWINPLIEGSGNMTIIDSIIEASPNLDRKWQRYRPQSVGLEGQGPYATLQSAPFTGALNMTGDLTLERSTFSYVPISAWGGEISIIGSRFLGDCELVTIGCNPEIEVTVKDSDFILHIPKENQERYSIDEITWLLAIERGRWLTTVKGCTFTGQGTGIGIHINRGAIVLEDCTFSDLLVSLWVHDVVPSEEWIGFDPTMDFQDSSGVHYLETKEVIVYFEGEGIPAPSANESGEWNGHWPSDVIGIPTIYMMKYETPHYQIITLPSIIVGPHLRENVVKSTKVYCRPDWVEISNGRTVTIDHSITEMRVAFNDSVPVSSTFWGRVSSFSDVGNANGILQQEVSIRIDHENLLSSYLNVTLDGEVIEAVDLVEINNNITDYEEELYFNHSIPTGPHNLTYHLIGTKYNDTGRIDIRIESTMIYRIDRQPEDDVFAWVIEGYNHGIVMVDEGVEVQGLEYSPEQMPRTFSCDIITGRGSEVTIDRLDVSSDYGASLSLLGNGTIIIEDLLIPFLWYEFKNCTVIIGNISTDFAYGSGRNVNLTLDGGTIKDLRLIAYNDSNLQVQGLNVALGYTFIIQCFNSSLYMRDCVFSGSAKYSAIVAGVNESNIEVRDCTFEGAPLDARLYEGNTSLRVTGCDFSGEGAYLFVLPSHYYTYNNRALLDTMPIGGSVDGNVFDGPGTGLIFYPPYKDVLLGVNTFIGEAKTLAFFRPNVTILEDDDDYLTITTLSHYKITVKDWIDHSEFEEEWLNYLVDVTDNIERMEDPGLVDVVLIETHDKKSLGGRIVSFQEIQVADSHLTIHFTDWDYIGDEISRMYNTYGRKVNRWEW
jgi:hypothetical protein